MADERDEWLDQDAAERLLRGEPVDPVDDHAREQARRLTAALEAMRAEMAAPAPPAALPGEEAALAAFREARAAKSAGASAALSSPSAKGVGGDLGAVRLRAAPPRDQVRGRWTRPLRWGLAASVAGLAVGGVAVAASTGVLPVLGDDHEPLPASSSASAAATPGPLVSSDASEDGGGTSAGAGSGAATPGTPADPSGTPPSPGETPPPSLPGSPAPEGPGTGRDNVSAGSGDGSGPGGAEPGTGIPDVGGTTGTGGGSGSWYARTAQACHDYRQGRLDNDKRRYLELAAKGDTVKKFCDKVLGTDTRSREGGTTGGDAEDGGDSDRGGGSGGSGGGQGGKNGGGTGGGAGTGAGGGGGGKGRAAAPGTPFPAIPLFPVTVPAPAL